MGKKNDLKKEIGERIKGVRIELKLNQTSFGDKIGLKQQQIAKIESGDQNPDIATIILLNQVFGISYNYLLSGNLENQKNDEYLQLKKENERLTDELKESQKDVIYLLRKLKEMEAKEEKQRQNNIKYTA